jgi:ribonuclease P protein component
LGEGKSPDPKTGLAMDRLKIRSDFLRAARGVRRSAGGLTLELCPTPEASAKEGRCRVGFTASRKVGGAVQRNRAKRRLRAAAAAVLPLLGLPGNDYVLVARQSTLVRPFSGLLDDLAGAVKAAHAKLGRPKAEAP